MYHANKDNIKLRVFLATTNEQCVITNIRKSTTVQSLKEKIEARIGIPSSLLRLFYLDECELLSGKQLRYFHIQNDAKILARIWRSHEELFVASKNGNWNELEKELSPKSVCKISKQVQFDTERCLFSLYISCHYGNHEVVESLLSKTGVAYRDRLESGTDAIMVAALNGNIKCVELLLRRKVRPHEWNNERMTLTNWELQDRIKATLDRIARIETTSTLFDHSRITNSQHFDSGFATWYTGQCSQKYLCEILTGKKLTEKNDGRPVFKP